MNIRDYRKKLVNAGQASPEKFGYCVSEIIKQKFKPKQKISIVDVGCGLGTQMSLIQKQLPNTFYRICGIDWSPATVEYHQNNENSIYDEVKLCDSSKLPFDNNEFDIALSMENLEHLYNDGCISSLKELQRISRNIIVTSPLPQTVINFNWLYSELVEAILDPYPLSDRDLVCLESAVHKSTIYPDSMLKAGFSIESADHGIYYGISDRVNINLVQYSAIKELSCIDFGKNKEKYLSLLALSASLQPQILNHPSYNSHKSTIKNRILRSPWISDRINFFLNIFKS